MSEGIEASFWPLLSDAYLRARYEGRFATREVGACYARRLCRLRRLPKSDLLWIEKELLPYAPFAFERALLADRRYVLDLDDAVFHSYDLAESRIVRRLLADKVDRLMAGAAFVIAGNGYLAQRARRAGARRVEMLPSVVDLDRYPGPRLRSVSDVPSGDSPLRVVWIGSPATAHYLDLVRVPIERFAETRRTEVHVVGAAAPHWKGPRMVSVPWSLADEVKAIACCDIGIMPLQDSAWERGKCGYKLIQYMACALPVIGSPVGANPEIVQDGVDGFLAATDDEWQAALVRLATDADLRRNMGLRGREKVEASYSLQAVAPRFAALLQEATR